METVEQREHPTLVDTIWKLLPTDPIAAYAKSGHPYAQYYYLRRHITDSNIPLTEKVQMMHNVIKFHVAPDLINNFTLAEFFLLEDALILEHLFPSTHFEAKLIEVTQPEIYCRLFLLYCVYLKRNQQLIQNQLLAFNFAKYLESIENPQLFADIVDMIEYVLPKITMNDLSKIYRIVFKDESQLQLTLRYLHKTAGVTDKLKVGSINEFEYVNLDRDRDIIELIWHRCVSEAHIKDYEILVALVMMRHGRNRDQAEIFIHQNYPHLLYGPIINYPVDNPTLLLILLTNPTYVRELAPNILVKMLRGPLLANLHTDAIKAILDTIIQADLSQDLHCECLFQILNHIIIPDVDESEEVYEQRNEIFRLILCDIKLLLEIQTEYPAQVRYFAFISRQLFSQHALATMIIATSEKDVVLKRLCNTIPRFNDLIIEFAVIENNQAALSLENRQRNQAEYKPKTNFAFDETQHNPRFSQRNNHASIIKQPVVKSISPNFTRIMTDIEIVPGSPAYREIKPRNFPTTFYSISAIRKQPQLPPHLALQRLFKGNNNILPLLNAESTLQELQEICLTQLIEQVSAEDINRLLDGQQANLANQVLFALVEILQLPYQLVSYYFNARYESQQRQELSSQNNSWFVLEL